MPLFQEVSIEAAHQTHSLQTNKQEGLIARSALSKCHYLPEVLIAGVDEAGRGPLIGSVVTAAVILDPNNPIIGLDDSKKLTAKKRDALFIEITEKALSWSICEATHLEIDTYNILQATLLAMRRAIESLPIVPSKALIDGNKCPKTSIPCQAIVGGDRLEQAISAASILAKVTRDKQLDVLDAVYPEYGFKKHKGYPTALHLQALVEHGVLLAHRRSYKPVRDILSKVDLEV